MVPVPPLELSLSVHSLSILDLDICRKSLLSWNWAALWVWETVFPSFPGLIC